MTADDRETLRLYGVTIENVHPASECKGYYCWVHNPSDHPLPGAQGTVLEDRVVLYLVGGRLTRAGNGPSSTTS